MVVSSSTYAHSTACVLLRVKKCSSHNAGSASLSSDAQNLLGPSRRVSILLMNRLHSKETGGKGRGDTKISWGQTVLMRFVRVPSALHSLSSCTHKDPSFVLISQKKNCSQKYGSCTRSGVLQNSPFPEALVSCLRANSE